jgi:hypothetical protein
MTTRTNAVDHPSRRLVVALPQTYDEARERYESLVPEVDFARFSTDGLMPGHTRACRNQRPSWVHALLPQRHHRRHVRLALVLEATKYLMGNHTIAERMFRHDPSVTLHAPLRTVLYVDPDGDTRLAVDQPSLLFASYDKPEIAAVGRELDGLLAGLITSLAGDTPPQLGTVRKAS